MKWAFLILGFVGLFYIEDKDAGVAVLCGTYLVIGGLLQIRDEIIFELRKKGSEK